MKPPSGKKWSLPLRRIVIEVDTREQDPLPFPRHLEISLKPFQYELVELCTVSRRLRIGDYRLRNYPRVGVVERKAGLNELATNLLTRDRHRFNKAFSSFVTGCDFPILLIEDGFGPATLNYPAGKIQAIDVRAALYRLHFQNPRLQIIWNKSTTNRKRTEMAGELARLLITAAHHRAAL